MASSTAWPLLLASTAALVLLYPVLGISQLNRPPESPVAVFEGPANRTIFEVEQDFLAPSTADPAAQRQPCNGFAQLATLKGDWAEHPDPTYRGLNPNSTCPSFVQDFDCLNGHYIPDRYKGRAQQVYRRVFKPHVCELHPFSPHVFEACMKGRRIIIIGDSTMRQLFQSLACLLTPVIASGEFLEWKDATPAHTNVSVEKPYLIRDEWPNTILKQNVGNFTLRNGASMHIRSFGIFNVSLWDDVMAEFMPLSARDVLIVEFGAWYPRFNFHHMHTPWLRYQYDMTELFEQRLKVYPALVLWRSYGPTHFGGPSGTYTAMTDHMPHLPAQQDCEPASHGEYFYDTWVHAYLSMCGDECNNIHMLPVYHLSLPAHDSHHGSFGRGIETKHIDCRHYCSNVIDVWGQVLFNKLCFGPRLMAGLQPI